MSKKTILDFVTPDPGEGTPPELASREGYHDEARDLLERWEAAALILMVVHGRQGSSISYADAAPITTAGPRYELMARNGMVLRMAGEMYLADAIKNGALSKETLERIAKDISGGFPMKDDG